MPDNPADAVQDLRIGAVETTAKDNAVRLGAVERSVVEIHGEIKGQNSTLDDIKAGTAALGGDFRDEMRALREGQATERKEEREAAALEGAAAREAASAWWTSAFKLAGAIVTVLGGIATAGAVATGSLPGISKAAPAAIEAAP